jgi:beta-glucosidase
MYMFDKNFIWGVATAAYQIEGGAFADGKKASIWDTFSHTEEKIFRNHNGDSACDHYHRFREDIALMKELGVMAYRFSLSWPRIIPDGVGKVNTRGLDFYHALLEELAKNGIEPYVTLYHWDLPQALQDQGGWQNPESVAWFKYYTEIVIRSFGNKVKNYITLNEPQCIVNLGLNRGLHAPGLHLPLKEQLRVIHHLLLAHGEAVGIIRRETGAKVGYAGCSWVPVPVALDQETIAAAREEYFSVRKNDCGDGISIWSDPIFFGNYPEKYYRSFSNLPEIRPGDWEIINRPVDYFFVNLYSGYYLGVREGKVFYPEFSAGSPRSDCGWDILPEIMYWGPKFLYERYRKPVIISECGIALPDHRFLDGKVHDPGRIDFLQRYLSELERGYREGVPVAGFFHWSLLDNFEWADGFSKRFGLVYVDYQSQERIKKDSFAFYRDLIKHYDSKGESCD